MFVKTATGFDAYGLRRRNLYVVDVVVVPKRFEQTIGETADQNVLYRFLAQVVVDAVDLLLAHDLEQAAIELDRTGQIGTERFLDHYPAKPVAVFLQQT